MDILLMLYTFFLGLYLASVDCQEVKQDFQVDCIRPLGIRITPNPDYRVLQTGCRGQDINVPLEPPYDVSEECIIATDTGTAVQVILEESTSSSNLVGGFQSRVFVVSCDFPGSEGYKDTFNRQIQGIKQSAGLDPTATSGVFKFTGVLMSVIDKATFTARRWAEHLTSTALIGQELFLTISHQQKDEGQAYIIPRMCRVKPETGNFTTIWDHSSTKRRCFEVAGVARDPVRIFTDVTSQTDVMSLKFFGFQFLGHESEVITFECDVLLCGDITTGSCGREWNKSLKEKKCITSKPPQAQTPKLTGRRRRRQATISHIRPPFANGNSGRTMMQEETVRVEIRMLMPRAKLNHVGSGSRILQSSIVALLLTYVVDLFSSLMTQ